jgi:tRNA(Met) C34 N-acetyltransferase TmcA
MIKISETHNLPTYGTNFFAAVGVALIGAQCQYPEKFNDYKLERVSSYVTKHDTSTFSNYRDNLEIVSQVYEEFAQSLGEMYSDFAKRQEYLGKEFQDVIFNDIESLYES